MVPTEPTQLQQQRIFLTLKNVEALRFLIKQSHAFTKEEIINSPDVQHSCFVYMFNNYGLMHKSLGLGETELLWLA